MPSITSQNGANAMKPNTVTLDETIANASLDAVSMVIPLGNAVIGNVKTFYLSKA